MNQLQFLNEKECWVVRADRGESIDGFRNAGVAALDFNITELPSEGVEVFKDKNKTYSIFEKYHPHRPKSFPNWWGTFNMFCNHIKIGDVILAPTSNGSLIIGVVEGDVYFQVGDPVLIHTIRRKVNWIEGVFSKNELPFSSISMFCNSTCFYVVKTKNNDEEEVTENSTDLIPTDIDGVVYIMKSNTFNDIFKVGYADRDAELRCSALSSDKKYGIFNLEVIGFVRCKNFKRLEKAMHNHFAPVRIFSENGCNLDSELFNSKTFPQDFKDYLELLVRQKYYQISEVNLFY